jgi:hypothetical protein
MEKSKERLHGYATESTMLIHAVDITVKDRSVGTGGEGIGHLHG